MNEEAIEHYFDDDLITDQTSWMSQDNDGGIHTGVAFCVNGVQVSLSLDEMKEAVVLLEYEKEVNKHIFEEKTGGQYG